MKYSIIFVLTAIFVISCSYIGTTDKGSFSPIQAIELSAASAPETIKGVFEFTVQSTNTEQRLEFVNSELDDLDQRNLIIAIRPAVVKELKLKYDAQPKEVYS